MFKKDRGLKPRKKSYYPFSKEYPSRRTGTKYAIGETRARRKKERRSTLLYALTLVLAFLVVFLIASVSISLSNRPLFNRETHARDDGTLRAIYMTADELGGGIAFDLFQNTLIQQDANAVLLDYKSATGRIYGTAADAATQIGAVSDGSEAAAQTVQRLKEKGYKIITRIYCFQDPLAAAQLPGAAVTEADGVTVWLDDSARNGGNPWLNPYADVARSYLLQVVREAVSFGADVVLLDGVCFPQGRYQAQAVFPGEQTSTFSRNAILHDFIEQAKLAAGEVTVAVCMPLAAALQGDSAAYDGGIFDSAADFCAVDFARAGVPEQMDLHGTPYTAALSEDDYVTLAVAALQARLEENYRTKEMLPIISEEADVSKLAAVGIVNYIWIAEENT